MEAGCYVSRSQVRHRVCAYMTSATPHTYLIKLSEGHSSGCSRNMGYSKGSSNISIKQKPLCCVCAETKLKEFPAEEKEVLKILTQVNVTRRQCEIVRTGGSSYSYSLFPHLLLSDSWFCCSGQYINDGSVPKLKLTAKNYKPLSGHCCLYFSCFDGNSFFCLVET